MSTEKKSKNINKLEREASITRQTRETEISVSLNLDGIGEYDIDTCLLYTSDAADE
mgnify:CR=1 FL=1